MRQITKVYDINGTRRTGSIVGMTRGNGRKIIWGAVLVIAAFIFIPVIFGMLEAMSGRDVQPVVIFERPSSVAERVLHRNRSIDAEFRKAMGEEEKKR